MNEQVTETAAPDNTGFAALFEQQGRQQIEEGGELVAKVVDATESFLIIDAGLKSEARVPKDEFVTDEGKMEVDVNGSIEVEVELLDNGRGETMLSRRNIRRKRMWHKIRDAYKNDGTIEGVIQSRVKGGFSVMCDSVRAFLPWSLVDVFPVSDATALLGARHEFKPVKMNYLKNSVVVSRRAVIEQQMLGGKDGDPHAFVEGSQIKGTVRAIVDYGAFVEIRNGIFGLLHITDISWKHVSSVADVLKVGDEAEVVILRVDTEKGRISLGMKQLQPDPWEYFHRTHPVGARVFGKVIRILDFGGVIVEIGDGVQGLVRSHDVSWKGKAVAADELYKPGDEAEVMVLEIDQEKRRILLGLKQCQPNPWQDFAASCRKGDKVKGVIRAINEYGLFVELPGNIEGLVRLANLSYGDCEEAVKQYSKGQEVETIVLAIDAERERISLGIRQLQDGDFEQFVENHLKGSAVSGVVREVLEKGGANIELDGARAYLPISEVSEERVEKTADHIKEGERLDFVLIDIDHKNRRAIVSLKEKSRADRDKLLRSRKPGQATTKLGELLAAKGLGARAQQQEEQEEQDAGGQEQSGEEEQGGQS